MLPVRLFAFERVVGCGRLQQRHQACGEPVGLTFCEAEATCCRVALEGLDQGACAGSGGEAECLGSRGGQAGRAGAGVGGGGALRGRRLLEVGELEEQ
eukprot:357022-Prymnesium_polylepis.1